MIVITGGSGFIGSALVWRLNQKGITDILGAGSYFSIWQTGCGSVDLHCAE